MVLVGRVSRRRPTRIVALQLLCINVDSLTPAEAAAVAGVPAAQLVRWAWEDWDVYAKRASGQVGPRNCGTRSKPLWREADVVAWRRKYATQGDAA